MKIIISHQNTDFDALGSMLAAQKLYEDHQMVLSSSVSPLVQDYLALHRDWLRPLSRSQLSQEEVEEVVVVDTQDSRRVREFSKAIEAASRVIVIDHHTPGEHDLEADEAQVEPVGACGTLLVESLEVEAKSLTVEEATLILLGIYADTGKLCFPSTTARDMRASAYLREQGASLPVINRYLQKEYTPAQQQLLVGLIGAMEQITRQGIDIGVVAYETQDYVKGAALVVERLMQLMGMDACFAVLREEGDSVSQLIGRSNSRQVDASVVAAKFGGGGHPSAAAARTSTSSFKEMVEGLKQFLKELELAPLEVRDVMSSPVRTVPHDMTLRELEACLKLRQISGVPVTREGELAGVVSQRDVAKAVDRGDWEVPVAGFMSHHVKTVSPRQSIEEALAVMTEHDIGRLPVMSEGDIKGIISRSDVIDRLYEDGLT